MFGRRSHFRVKSRLQKEFEKLGLWASRDVVIRTGLGAPGTFGHARLELYLSNRITHTQDVNGNYANLSATHIFL